MKAVNLGNRENKTWFAPEQLQILPFQLYNRPVSDHFTESMLQTANRLPEQNKTFLLYHGLPSLKVPFQVTNPFVAILSAWSSSHPLVEDRCADT
jgi:hypothetical protein